MVLSPGRLRFCGGCSSVVVDSMKRTDRLFGGDILSRLLDNFLAFAEIVAANYVCFPLED